MREIKFRVWSSLRNIFIFSGATILQLINECDGDLELPILLSEGGNVYQQYTGLKDINGKEIYEGDIVRNTSKEFVNENFTGVVTYSDCFFGLELINGEPKEWRGIDSDMEVIGNIYENQELLK